MEQEQKALNCWAPEIFYDKKEKLYMIYWATTIPGRFPETDSTGDNDYNHRIYYTTTRNFQDYAPAQLLYDQGFNVIDATLLYQHDTYYMLLKDETRHPAEKNIRIAHSQHLTGPYSKPSRPITGGYWAEGPTVTQIGAQWVVFFDKYTEHRMGAVASKDLKNWQDISDKIHFPEGTRHGSVLKISRKVLDQLIQAAP